MQHLRKTSLTLVVALLLIARADFVGSEVLLTHGDRKTAKERAIEFVCNDSKQSTAAGAALQFVCRQGEAAPTKPSPEQIIVIGFVGGFANPSDTKHPEVLFAAYLREHYGPDIHAEVFSNHEEKRALRYTMGVLDVNHDGVISDEEKRSARIIVYGHSWGASEATAFARELGRVAIPVLLTVQIDIVGKLRQTPSRIPPNVQKAINFYQSEGLLRGQSEILASDPTRTEIIGNVEVTYRRRTVDCHNYPWFARTFNKPHHEIENDPNVWREIGSLIDDGISNRYSANKLGKDIALGDSRPVSSRLSSATSLYFAAPFDRFRLPM